MAAPASRHRSRDVWTSPWSARRPSVPRLLRQCRGRGRWRLHRAVRGSAAIELRSCPQWRRANGPGKRLSSRCARSFSSPELAVTLPAHAFGCAPRQRLAVLPEFHSRPVADGTERHRRDGRYAIFFRSRGTPSRECISRPPRSRRPRPRSPRGSSRSVARSRRRFFEIRSSRRCASQREPARHPTTLPARYSLRVRGSSTSRTVSPRMLTARIRAKSAVDAAARFQTMIGSRASSSRA